MTTLSEDELVRLYRRTVRDLFDFVARRSGGDAELAEDVTQEAWLRALARWRRGGPPDDPLPWLRTVARNLLWNHFRDRRPAVCAPEELDLVDGAAPPGTPNAAAALHWGLARLRRGQARLLEAHHLDGKATRTIAAEMGLSERAVEGRLRRSRLALRQCLTPYLRT